MAKIRKRLAIAAARNFAAGLVENMEVGLLDSLGFSEEEYKEMQAEMSRIAARIAATVNREVLSELGTLAERAAAERESIMQDFAIR